jgi:hypothetical protein
MKIFKREEYDAGASPIHQASLHGVEDNSIAPAQILKAP